jgi:TMEM175 potassium channel family protein
METTRLEIFSDGVFAIVITLLGLELQVPLHEGPPGRSLAASLAAAWPGYVAFLTSFITVAVVWINHHRLFMHIVRVDHSLLLWNGLLLMTVTLVPFGNAVLAEHMGSADQRTAAMLYSCIFIAVTSSFNLLWRHAARGLRLLDHTVDRRTIRRISYQYGFGPALYVLSLGMAAFNAWVSVVADLVFVVFFALPLFSWGTSGSDGGQRDAPSK